MKNKKLSDNKKASSTSKNLNTKNNNPKISTKLFSPQKKQTLSRNENSRNQNNQNKTNKTLTGKKSENKKDTNNKSLNKKEEKRNKTNNNTNTKTGINNTTGSNCTNNNLINVKQNNRHNKEDKENGKNITVIKEIEKAKKNENHPPINLNLTKKEMNNLSKQYISSMNAKLNINIKLNSNSEKVLNNLLILNKDLCSEIDKIKKRKEYLNEYSLNNLPVNNIINQNLKKDELKNLQKNENILMEKVKNINQQINLVISENKDQTQINNKNNNEYLQKAQMDKKFNNVISKKIKKLQIENNLYSQKRIKNYEKNSKKIDEVIKLENNKQEVQKHEELIQKNKLEKLIVARRQQQVKTQAEKNRMFLNNPNNINKENYLYIKMNNLYNQKELEYFNKMKKINEQLHSNEKINKTIDYEDILNKKKLDNEEKIINLHKIWQERSNSLPKYKSPLYEKFISSEENKIDTELKLINNKKELFLKKEKYSENIRLPPISIKLQQEREKRDISLFNHFRDDADKNVKIKPMYHFKSVDLSKKSRNIINMKKSFSLISNNNNNNKKIINKFNEIKKSNSSIGIKSIVFKHKINFKTPKEFNYLEELRKERESKNKNGLINLKNLLTVNNIGEDGASIDAIKGKIEVMEEKFKQGKELLKIKGGYINNQELGDKMSSLLITSIKNKLDIIENMNK